MLIIDRKRLYSFVFSMVLIFSIASIFGFGENAVETVAPPVSGITVVIDPGHGLPDGGAVGLSGTLEYELNLKIARELGSLLQQSGAKVVYTREDDYSVGYDSSQTIRNIKRNDLNMRKQIAESSDADLFISIHMNKFEDSKYKGAQVFYDTSLPQNEKLAQSIQKYIRDFADNSNTREAKKSGGSIYVLKDLPIPSALVECGFISNQEEEKKLQTASYQKKIAFSVYCGIINYLNESRQ